MKYTRLQLSGHDVCLVDYLSDQVLMERARTQAAAKAPYTHENSPSARKRSPAEVFNAQLLGTIADIACTSLLQTYLQKYATGQFLVERYDDIRTDNYQDHDQFDIRLVDTQDRQVLSEIEVRSSVCNRIPAEAMIRSWHVLGWYVTKNKAIEQIRDFYMRPIYHFRSYNSSLPYSLANAEDYLLNNTLDLYLIGGATKAILQNQGEIQRGFGLLQDGATYQVVEIRKSLGIGKFLNGVLNFTGTEI